MIDDDCKVIMEVHEQTTDIPLSLTNSIRIPPHTIAVVVVECAKPLNSTMDIRADEGFLMDFPNIHVARSYVNNPKESLAPNCIPFVFTNLSMYSQYLGKDKVVGFAQPTAEDIEVHTLADHDELAEMMRGPQNHIPHKKQAKYKLPIICKLLFASFLISSCPKCTLVWGNYCERLRIEIFVRVLRSSEVISLILCK